MNIWVIRLDANMHGKKERKLVLGDTRETELVALSQSVIDLKKKQHVIQLANKGSISCALGR